MNIQFQAGNEQRFSHFISGLSEGKIALISHTDLDGISAAKVANEVLRADIVKFTGYDELNDSLVHELKKSNVKKIIFTDLFIKEGKFIKELEKFADILIIDHHLFSENLNSEKTVFINAQGYCAAYVCYYLFSKIKNLEKFDWLVAGASVGDWQWFQNQPWLNKIYDKYGDKFVNDPKGIQKGILWDRTVTLSNAIIYFRNDLNHVFNSIQGYDELGDLEDHAAEVDDEIESSLKRFENEKIPIKGGYFWEFAPHFRLNSVIST
ncbi:DHH family phosphoesterase, partial [Candidatus Pacearchaeota archaeon]|nr:DHH family phosphoesterase [Candidatus Pacearchaeota archaeon]